MLRRLLYCLLCATGITAAAPLVVPGGAAALGRTVYVAARPPGALTVGLVGWWLDSDADRSGGGHALTRVGDAVWADVAGRRALALDGVGDWAQLNADLLVSGTATVAVSAYITSPADFGVAGGSAYDGYGPAWFGGSAYAAVPSGAYASFGAVAVPRGVWVHIAWVQTGTQWLLYRDGALVATVATALTGYRARTLGALYLFGLAPLAGAVRDYRIYARPLSAAEILALATGAAE